MNITRISLTTTVAMWFYLPTIALADGALLPPAGPDDLAFSVENMDTSVDPAVNFYRYASGKWQDRIERPSQLSVYGSLAIAGERTKEQMKIAVAQAGLDAADAPKGSPTQLVGDFYNAFMDTAALDAAGIEPIRDQLDRIAAISDLDDLVQFMAEMPAIGGPVLFAGFGPSGDFMDSKKYIMYGVAGGFSVDDKNEDLLAEGPGDERFEAYRTYIHDTLVVAGYDADTAARMAETVLQIETEMFAAKLTPQEKIDPRVFYNPTTLKDLQAQIPELDIAAYLERVGYAVPETIIVAEPRFFPVLSKMFRERTIDELKDYSAFRLIDNYHETLTTAFDEPVRAFNEVLTGVAVIPPREERALSFMKETLGHPLSQVYVDAFYSEETRDKALDMVNRIQAVFLERMPSRDWLSDETRAEAQDKLENFYYRVGYPDEWVDYSQVDIGEDVITNVKNIAEFLDIRQRDRATRPVEHEQFNTESTLPLSINAAYDPTINGFEVPAAIQQPPVFDAASDAPVYFCRLGGIIGHEMTHGFDSGGRLFDADGNLRDWWTPEDGAAFDVEAQKLIDQANAVEILPGLNLNGALNVKENMADVGGITFAHQALMDYLDEHPDENVEIEGMTPSQRCFVSWAQMWTWKATEQFIRSIVANDGHPPSEYRAYAPLQHLEAFYEAFDINEGDPMWLAPEKRVNAW